MGLLICDEYRYPELFRQYKSQGVQLVLHSYHNAGAPRFRKHFALTGQVVRATMQARAASNYVWISVNNSCRRVSCWGSFVVRPDGMIVDKAPRHSPKVLINAINTSKTFYDASVKWRDRAIAGVFHSGRLVND